MDMIHYSRCRMVPTASSLAFQLGLLQQETAALASGEVELAIGDYDHHDDRLWLRHAGTSKPLWARAQGADTRAIGFSWHETAQPIFARADSGMAAPGDLAGRRIALVRVTHQPFDVERAIYFKPYFMALAAAGLGPAHVRVVDTELRHEPVRNAAPAEKSIFARIGEIFLDQLVRGEVNAIATPLPAEAIRAHSLVKIYDARLDANPDARTDLRGLVVSASVLRERRDTLVRLVARLIQAGQWAARQPDEACRLLATDLRLEERALRLRGIDPVRLSAIDCSDEQIAFLDRKKDFLRATGMIERDVGVEDWVDASIVRAARDLLIRQAAA